MSRPHRWLLLFLVWVAIALLSAVLPSTAAASTAGVRFADGVVHGVHPTSVASNRWSADSATAYAIDSQRYLRPLPSSRLVASSLQCPSPGSTCRPSTCWTWRSTTAGTLGGSVHHSGGPRTRPGSRERVPAGLPAARPTVHCDLPDCGLARPPVRGHSVVPGLHVLSLHRQRIRRRSLPHGEGR
jgi:hypothetical protein